VTSTDQPFLSVVVPAYNEERRLPATLQQIIAYLDQQPYRAEIIVADDGSTDNTAALVEQWAAKHSNLRILRLDHRGKGFAVRAGALAAQGRYVLLCDADLATPIEEWEKLLTKFQAGYGVVIGSREGMGAQRVGEPWYRHIMGRVFNTIIRVVALRGIQDTQCGFKALHHEACKDLFNRVQVYGDDAPTLQGPAVTAYDVELLFLALKRGYRVAEVPVMWQYGTETKVNPLRDSLLCLRDVLTVRWYSIRGRYRDLDAPLPAEFAADRRS
jgi:dolichyl-phosphate beta-glucosyltransferase